MGKTTIEWCDYTMNPWIGCSKVSAGCASCYAETLMDKRWKKVSWGKGKPRKFASPGYWWQPIKWDKEAGAAGIRRRVFCASLADVFDEEVSDDWRRKLFMTIAQTPNLDWLLLTKRSKKMRDFMQLDRDLHHLLRNVWLGVSVEDQKTADERIPDLLASAAAVRFVSYEPALGPVDFTRISLESVGKAPFEINPLTTQDDEHFHNDHAKLDWVIIGGESGPRAREFQIEWARNTVSALRSFDTPVFVKQLGANLTAAYYYPDLIDWWEETRDSWPDPIGWSIARDGQPALDARVRLQLKDRKGGDPKEWPEDLRVREFPALASTERA